MCIGGSSPKPPSTPAITPVIQPSQAIDQQAQAANAAERRRLQALAGQQSTILTGTSLGATMPTSANKTLLGS